MSDFEANIKDLKSAVDEAVELLDLDKKRSDLAELDSKMQMDDFWSDNKVASEVSKKHAGLKKLIDPWQELEDQVAELADFAKMHDKSLHDELIQRLTKAKAKFDDLKSQLKFQGEYDSSNALISIHAGAGGTDAQDWAGMLLRMYSRWAEQNDFKAQLLHESKGEQAGVKSVTMKIEGQFACGWLRGEHGVHRLVRLSPFNSAGSRETSFAMVEVLPELDDDQQVELDESDLKIDVYRASGHGGQSVNTTDSAVRITHVPTGVKVAIQNERSQLQNKETALKVLASKLQQLAKEQQQEKLAELKGPNQEAAWGNQIRSYVLHPYTSVKDARTKHEEKDAQAVLDGKLGPLLEAYLEYSIK